MLFCPLMLNNYQQHFNSFPHLAEGLWKSSVYFKWLNKHYYVLYNGCNMDSS